MEKKIKMWIDNNDEFWSEKLSWVQWVIKGLHLVIFFILNLIFGLKFHDDNRSMVVTHFENISPFYKARWFCLKLVKLCKCIIFQSAL